ncbi:MAG: hypothetical protein L0216_11085 [Planctomycetales bacterium]|nr:hypothetical protein [Planctomycetales bacterium]
MPLVLAGSAVWTLVLFGVAAALAWGWFPDAPEHAHRLAGILAAVFAVSAHGLAFTLGIAFPRILLEAAKAGALPESFGVEARRLMAGIVSRAALSMLAIVAAGVLGGAADTGAVSLVVHASAAGIALAAAMAAFAGEIVRFRRLRELFRKARAHLDAAEAEPNAATSAPDPRPR